MKGLLIALEGIDGAGNTTQARLLARWLRRLGLGVVLTKEPTKGAVGRLIRRRLKRGLKDPFTDTLLFAADRLQHLERTIEPLLSKGYVVVSDRYLHSSLAYQAATTGDPEWVRELNKHARRPDLALLLDVKPQIGLRRIRRKRRSRFEQVELLEKIRENYLRMVERGELLLVDASRDAETVSETIREIVGEFLERT